MLIPYLNSAVERRCLHAHKDPIVELYSLFNRIGDMAFELNTVVTVITNVIYDPVYMITTVSGFVFGSLQMCLDVSPSQPKDSRFKEPEPSDNGWKYLNTTL